MKDVFPQAELTQMPAGYRVLNVHILQVSGLEAARHLQERLRASRRSKAELKHNAAIVLASILCR